MPDRYIHGLAEVGIKLSSSVSDVSYDAVVVGSGPNGLAAAITLAADGRSVLVLEGADTPGGGARSAELTLPGFVHDICSAIHPLAAASPFFRQQRLEKYGLHWIQPEIAVAHPFDDGTAAVLHRSIEESIVSLAGDAASYRGLVEPFVEVWEEIVHEFLGPLRLPKHPLTMIRFASKALRSTAGLARSTFNGGRAQALFTGLSAHSMLDLTQAGTAGFGLMLAIMAHAVGWPLAQGGSQNIVRAMVNRLSQLGVGVRTGIFIESMQQLPAARAYLFDTSPGALSRIAEDHLPAHYRQKLERYRYGPGVFKIDWALEQAIPWQAAACRRAGTVHIGGSMEEIIDAERLVCRGQHPEKPFVILAQQSLFDRTRTPGENQAAWAYCHVPNGSRVDMSRQITEQIERFAPGFSSLILAESKRTASDLQSYNPNYVSGDINGGLQDLRQLYTRPLARLVPYGTPSRNIYLCSSSTPPGGGVHGLCGYFAAKAALEGILKQDG